MKKLIFLVVLMFGIGLAVAQPPPPHPGGSGNQGAPVAYDTLFFLSVLLTSIVIKYKMKR